MATKDNNIIKELQQQNAERENNERKFPKGDIFDNYVAD